MVKRDNYKIIFFIDNYQKNIIRSIFELDY